MLYSAPSDARVGLLRRRPDGAAVGVPRLLFLRPVQDFPMSPIAPISQQIWDMKYRLKGPDGTPVDQSIPDTWRRIARALAQPEADPAAWEAPFAAALEAFRFLPAGRLVPGAGPDRNATLFHCFVMRTTTRRYGNESAARGRYR